MELIHHPASGGHCQKRVAMTGGLLQQRAGLVQKTSPMRFTPKQKDPNRRRYPFDPHPA